MPSLLILKTSVFNGERKRHGQSLSFLLEQKTAPFTQGSRFANYTIKSSYFSRTCALENTPMMDENLDKPNGAHKFCESEHPSKQPLEILISSESEAPYALPLQPSTLTSLCLTSSLMLARAGLRYCLGSKCSGDWLKCSRIAAVIARRRSESMLILQTAMEAALRSISSGIPIASGILPPLALMISTYLGITEEAP